MWLDVSLAVLMCVVTSYMAYLGVHVTLHPTEEPRKQKCYKIQFWICCGTALVLIAVQTVKNAQTQSAIRRQLANIERNTKQPPTVQTTVNVPPAQIITVDEAEKAKRKAIRKQLGKLLGEGNALRSACDTLDKDMRWHNWSSKVERYLANNLGSDYVARFKAIEQFNTICWAGIGQEMNMLDEFIRDFQ
jgi:hypothetical protein